MHTQFFQFVKNRARQNGGAVAAMDSLASGSISLQDSAYKGNIARRGGAIFVDSISDFRLQVSSGQKSLFEDNAALAGGAIYARLQNPVRNQLLLAGALFRHNRAVNVPADVGYQLVEVPQRDASAQASRTDDEGIEEVVLDPYADDPCTPGGGGALCVALTRVPERGAMRIFLKSSNFTENSALTGGELLGVLLLTASWSRTLYIKVGIDNECFSLRFESVLILILLLMPAVNH